MSAYQRLVDSLINIGQRVEETRAGEDAMAQCPAHDDNRPSLHIMRNHGQVVMYCHAQCPTESILDALGWTMADLFDNRRDDRYVYQDSSGAALRTVIRTAQKHFRQTGDTSTATLYRLPAVKAAVARGETVYLVEGEKDVHAIEAAGAIATTTPGGGRNFRNADLAPLEGAHVVAIIDNDDTGRAWAQQVADQLAPIAGSVRFAQARAGKDAADHLLAGYDLSSLCDVQVQPVNGHAEPEQQQRPPRLVQLLRSSTIKPQPVTWLWEHNDHGRIPASALSIFAGREATGKSTFAAWLTARITTGTLPGAFAGQPRPVVYVSIEESWSQALIPKLTAAGADLDLVHLAQVLTDADEETSISLPIDNVQLEAVLATMGGGMMVIDPLMSVISARIDTHRERDVRTALDPLARIADRTGTAIVGIAHFSKAASSDVASLITGSGAFKNVARAVFGFAEDDGERVMSQVKNSLGVNNMSLNYDITPLLLPSEAGPIETVRFDIRGISDRHVSDILRSRAADTEDPEERNAAQEWLVDFLTGNGGEHPAGDVLKAGRAAGFSDMQVKNARRRCQDPRVATRRATGGNGWVWGLEYGEIGRGASRGAEVPAIGSLAPWHLDDTSTGVAGQERTGQDKPEIRGIKSQGSTPAPDPWADEDQDRPRCTACLEPLPDSAITDGFTVHPSCEWDPTHAE